MLRETLENLGRSPFGMEIHAHCLGHGGPQGSEHFKAKSRVSWRDARSKLQRVSSEDRRTSVLGQALRRLTQGVCSQRRCGESPRVKLQRVSSEDCRTPVCGQAVKQSAKKRTALLPTMLWGKSPFEVAESVIGRPKDSSSWTGSKTECRVAVCVGVLRNSTFIP